MFKKNYFYYTGHYRNDVPTPLYILHESEGDMAKKYFMSRLIYFHEPEANENKA